MNRRAHLHHLRMPVAVLVRQLGLLALQIAEVALQLLDVVVAEHRRERVDRVAVLNRPELVVEGFLFDSRRLGLGRGGVQIGQPLHDDVLPILDGDGVVLLLVALEVGLARLDLLPLLGQLRLEPVGGVLGSRETVLEVLLDIGPCVGVGQIGCQLRIRGGHADVDQPAVANGRDAKRAKHHARDIASTGRRPSVEARAGSAGPCRCRRRQRPRERPCALERTAHGPGRPDFPHPFANGGMLIQLHARRRASCETSALQDLVLRLVEVVVVPAVLLLEHRGEVSDLRAVLLDEQLRARSIQRRRPVAVYGADREDGEQDRNGDPAALVDHADVVHQMALFLVLVHELRDVDLGTIVVTHWGA